MRKFLLNRACPGFCEKCKSALGNWPVTRHCYLNRMRVMSQSDAFSERCGVSDTKAAKFAPAGLFF